MQNPSCFLYGPGDARFEDRPMPTIDDPLDVIIRIEYVGVCGSDVRTTETIPIPHNLRHLYLT
jgi:D-xylulose reductase